jgi:hypothetical protein
VSRNFKLYSIYFLTLVGFVLFVNNGLSNAENNVTTINTSSPNAQPNMTTPNAQPNMTTPNAQPTAAAPNTSSSITDTVNEVLSGSIDGMIGETVNMLASDTANMGKDSAKNSFENELPSSLGLGKSNHTAAEDSPTGERIQGNVRNNTLNNNKQIQANNKSTSDSVDEIKQSLQKSMYNSTIVQSFDNNTFTKLEDQNTFDEIVYKMKNILDIDLFK